MSNEATIACTSSGQYMSNKRQVALTVVSGVLQLHEGGRSVTITRALPFMWVGQGRNAPMWPLPCLALDGPGGAWVVSTTDTIIVPVNAAEQGSPAPHVFVSQEDFARMAAACGIEVTQREIQLPPPMSSQKTTMMIIGGCAVVGLFVTMAILVGPNNSKRRSTDSCTKQRVPVEELYERVSCQDARAELDRVARGEATPRPIVLRSNSMIVDARDTTGPATIICDGIEFAVVDALQSAPEPISFSNEGLHSVLVEERADGTLKVSQYCICCNIVGRERRGPNP